MNGRKCWITMTALGVFLLLLAPGCEGLAREKPDTVISNPPLPRHRPVASASYHTHNLHAFGNSDGPQVRLIQERVERIDSSDRIHGRTQPRVHREESRARRVGGTRRYRMPSRHITDTVEEYIHTQEDIAEPTAGASQLDRDEQNIQPERDELQEHTGNRRRPAVGTKSDSMWGRFKTLQKLVEPAGGESLQRQLSWARGGRGDEPVIRQWVDRTNNKSPNGQHKVSLKEDADEQDMGPEIHEGRDFFGSAGRQIVRSNSDRLRDRFKMLHKSMRARGRADVQSQVQWARKHQLDGALSAESLDTSQNGRPIHTEWDSAKGIEITRPKSAHTDRVRTTGPTTFKRVQNAGPRSFHTERSHVERMKDTEGNGDQNVDPERDVKEENVGSSKSSIRPKNGSFLGLFKMIHKFMKATGEGNLRDQVYATSKGQVGEVLEKQLVAKLNDTSEIGYQSINKEENSTERIERTGHQNIRHNVKQDRAEQNLGSERHETQAYFGPERRPVIRTKSDSIRERLKALHRLLGTKGRADLQGQGKDEPQVDKSVDTSQTGHQPFQNIEGTDSKSIQKEQSREAQNVGAEKDMNSEYFGSSSGQRTGSRGSSIRDNLKMLLMENKGGASLEGQVPWFTRSGVDDPLAGEPVENFNDSSQTGHQPFQTEPDSAEGIETTEAESLPTEQGREQQNVGPEKDVRGENFGFSSGQRMGSRGSSIRYNLKMLLMENKGGASLEGQVPWFARDDVDEPLAGEPVENFNDTSQTGHQPFQTEPDSAEGIETTEPESLPTGQGRQEQNVGPEKDVRGEHFGSSSGQRMGSRGSSIRDNLKVLLMENKGGASLEGQVPWLARGSVDEGFSQAVDTSLDTSQSQIPRTDRIPGGSRSGGLVQGGKTPVTKTYPQFVPESPPGRVSVAANTREDHKDSGAQRKTQHTQLPAHQPPGAVKGLHDSSPSSCSCQCNTPVREQEPTCEWKMVFKAVAGSCRDVHDDFMTDSTYINGYVRAAQAIPSDLPFKHPDIIHDWAELFISEVVVEVFSQGIRKAWFVFNGIGTDKKSWMTQDRLIASSYVNIKTGALESFTDFDDDTDTSFVIRDSSSGCYSTCGYLEIIEEDTPTDCPFHSHDEPPFFLYSTSPTGPGCWQADGEYDVGDRFVVSTKVCDIEW